MSTSQGSGGFFERTLWSTILKARQGDGEEGPAALERLLTRYRQPILRQIQASQRCSPDRAEDLCHDFIEQCLRVDFFKRVSPDQGRFRTFIKVCIKNFLCDEHARQTALKRGGGLPLLPLDESTVSGTPTDALASGEASPDEVLDRQWALAVVDQAMEMLRQECVAARRGTLFEALQGHLGRAPARGTAAEIGARLGMQEGAVHVAMSRLRARLGELIGDAVRQTVGTEEDWQSELKYLVDLLGR